MNISFNVGALVGPKVAKLQGKLQAISNLMQTMQGLAIQVQAFSEQLNKNFPKQDEILANFDQAVTIRVEDHRSYMQEVRAKIPRPKPPLEPICAVWPGIPGGSEGI